MASATASPSDAERIAASIAAFNDALPDIALPRIKDLRDGPPVQITELSPCICLLTEPDYRINVAQEGGRQSPGNVLMVVSPSWLDQRKQADGSNALFVKTAIWFDGLGQSFVGNFEPARRVTYFANFLTKPATGGQRCDGVQFEAGLQCPMSSSSKLEQVINDKLLTRMLLSERGVAHPNCLAIPFQANKARYERWLGLGPQILVRFVEKRDPQEDKVRKWVRKFLTTSQTRKIVVKPSGPMWMGSEGVSFHVGEDDIVGAAMSLLRRLYPGDAVLVEEFLSTIPSHLVLAARDIDLHVALRPAPVMMSKNATGEAANVMMSAYQLELDDEDEVDEVSDIIASMHKPLAKRAIGFRLRVMVARSFNDVLTITKMVCGIGPADMPINGDNSVPISLDAALDQWGIRDPALKAELMGTIADEARVVFRAIIDYENTLTAEERGGTRAQTDLIGLDFVITSQKEKVIVPAVIEVNDADCTLSAQILEYMLPATVGDSVRVWVRNMLARSMTHILSLNKTVLLVGGGGHSKMFVYELAKELELNIVMVDSDADHYAKSLVTKFVHIPEMYNHVEDEATAPLIVAKLAEAGIEVEGVLTVWEDCAPLAARVSELMGMRGNTYEAATIAKSKHLTIDTLGSQKTSWQHINITALFAAKAFKISSDADLAAAAPKMTFPAVLKLEYGSSAAGVLLVQDQEDCALQYRKLVKSLDCEETHAGIGLSFSSDFLLMEFLEGSEHDVDIIMFDGVIQAAFVTDNGPTHLPYFSETFATMPSALHPDKQGALIAAAVQCCNGVGLKNGVFNLEFKFTSTGPKLIEINGRMGGFYIRDWVMRVWGIDILQVAFLISLGVKPNLPKKLEPKCWIVGAMIYTSRHKEIMCGSFDAVSRLRQMDKEDRLVFQQFEPEFPDVEDFEEPFANLGVSSVVSRADAVARLHAIWQLVGLNDAPGPSLGWYMDFLNNN